MPQTNKETLVDECGVGVQVEDCGPVIRVSFIDFHRTGIALQLSVRKSTAPETLKAFFDGLNSSGDVYVGLLSDWLALNPSNRPAESKPKPTRTLKDKLSQRSVQCR